MFFLVPRQDGRHATGPTLARTQFSLRKLSKVELAPGHLSSLHRSTCWVSRSLNTTGWNVREMTWVGASASGGQLWRHRKRLVASWVLSPQSTPSGRGGNANMKVSESRWRKGTLSANWLGYTNWVKSSAHFRCSPALKHPLKGAHCEMAGELMVGVNGIGRQAVVLWILE